MHKSKDYKHLAGRPLINKDNHPVGRLDHVMEHEGEKYAVVDLREHFNTGERLFAVPWEALDLTDEGKATVHIEIDEAVLDDAERMNGQENGNPGKAEVFFFPPQVHWPS